MQTDRLIYVREEKDLKQIDVSKLLNIDRSALSHWERNSRTIPLTKLNDLCNLYQVSMDFIFNLTDQRTYKSLSSTTLNKEKIGKRILEIRKRYGLTLEDIANQFNSATSTVWGYENGKFLISTTFVYDLAKKYQLSMDWICCRIDD